GTQRRHRILEVAVQELVETIGAVEVLAAAEEGEKLFAGTAALGETQGQALGRFFQRLPRGRLHLNALAGRFRVGDRVADGVRDGQDHIAALQEVLLVEGTFSAAETYAVKDRKR